jgi:hypothetical protein
MLVVANIDIRVLSAGGRLNSSNFHHFLDLGSSKRAVYKIPTRKPSDQPDGLLKRWCTIHHRKSEDNQSSDSESLGGKEVLRYS